MPVASPEVPPTAEVVDSRSPQQSQSPEAISTGQSPVEIAHGFAYPTTSPSQTGDEHSAGEDLEEDIMDISRSELDEGESPEMRTELPEAEDQKVTGSIDDEEGYEPPTDINTLQKRKLDSTADIALSDGGLVELEIPDAMNDESSTDNQEAGFPQNDDEVFHNADMHGEEQASQRSPSLACTSESDDYEPPEATPVVAAPALRSQRTVVEPKLSSLTNIDVNGVNTSSPPKSLADHDHGIIEAKTMGPNDQKVVYRANYVEHTNVSAGSARDRFKTPAFHPL